MGTVVNSSRFWEKRYIDAPFIFIDPARSSWHGRGTHLEVLSMEWVETGELPLEEYRG
jgi:hypothetical protein